MFQNYIQILLDIHLNGPNYTLNQSSLQRICTFVTDNELEAKDAPLLHQFNTEQMELLTWMVFSLLLILQAQLHLILWPPKTPQQAKQKGHHVHKPTHSWYTPCVLYATCWSPLIRRRGHNFSHQINAHTSLKQVMLNWFSTIIYGRDMSCSSLLLVGKCSMLDSRKTTSKL